MIDPHTERLMMGAAGASGGETYVDDVFSTYLYKGTAGSNTVDNGIDISGEGGLVWFKERSGGGPQQMFDTLRGATKALRSSGTNVEETRSYGLAFNTNGYSLNSSDGNINSSSNTYASWTFRKAPGFFDVVTYTGNGVDGRTISHSLGCAPGLILFKRTDGNGHWFVWHKEFGLTQYALLNLSNAAGSMGSSPRHALPNATTVTLTDWDEENGDGHDFVAYLFAGGESTAATARSVDFDGSGDYLTVGSSSDFSMGTGDFTIEGWVMFDDTSSNNGIFQISDQTDGMSSTNTTLGAFHQGTYWGIYGTGGELNNSISRNAKQWYHVAYVRNSGTSKFYVNGNPIFSRSDTGNYDGTYLVIGSWKASVKAIDGKISNFRVVKGTAVYTSAFRPPTEPLTNITNTKLLCCNNSSTTGSTVTPGTITANGDPTASNDSPFDDPAAFTFGESGDKDIIKCGSYNGSGSANLEINVGWEPQYLLVKRTDAADSWYLADTMRGMTADEAQRLMPDLNEVEASRTDDFEMTPTGFNCITSDGQFNASGGKFIYIAIRSATGTVTRPPELGTDVFNMGVGQNSTTIPNYISGFPVDMGMHRLPAGTSSFTLVSRLMGQSYLLTNSTGAAGTGASWATFDSNTGYITNQQDNTHQAWMWKRHAGFDVVAYEGDGQSNRRVNHSCGKIPEMIWVKNRDTSRDWVVYHKGLNGGTNPQNYYLKLNTNDAEASTQYIWSEYAPTATQFEVDATGVVNDNNESYLAMLFASVDGISKCGYYNGSNSDQTITVGFQPRFLLVKNITDNVNWMVLDTLRGWGSGNDQELQINTNAAQNSTDAGTPTSTGFTVLGDRDHSNQLNKKYIYYAHA